MIASTNRLRSLMLLCGVALLLLPHTSAFAQREEAKPGQSVVRGRVLLADSEQPLRRATLRLRKEFNKEFLKRSISTRRGEFSFHAIPAGTYYIEVEAPGILAFSNGMSFTELGFGIEATNLPTVIVDGVNDVKAEVRVSRGGVLTGRVSYADGEPATRARIVLYRQTGEITNLFFTAHALSTDDRGVYRIEGLPSGQYFVGAVENRTAGETTLPRNAAGLVTAYHPAASSISTASTASVQAGSETREVNIKFGDEPRRLSGTLKWKQITLPPKHASVFLRRVGDPQLELDYVSFAKMVTPQSFDSTDRLMRDIAFLGLLSTNAPYVEVSPDGSWSFPDLPPGTYRVSAQARVPVNETIKPQKPKEGFDPEDDDDSSTKLVKGSVEVTIKDKDVENLSIELSEGGRISGTILIEGRSEVPAVAVKLNSAAGPKNLFDFPEYIKPDRSFMLQAVPAGTSRLDIVQPSVSYYYIKSITGKGLDLLNEPLTLNEGEQVTGVQIVLGVDLATIQGRVASTTGGSVAGAGIVLLPVDQRKWPFRSFWGLARADAEGRFTLRLAPGEYFALSWSAGNEPRAALESYAKANLTQARRVTLQPLETKTVELQASTKPVE